MKCILQLLLIITFLFCSCRSEEKKAEVVKKEVTHDVYVCPMECENGMNYYLEGKCDICHINLVKKK